MSFQNINVEEFKQKMQEPDTVVLDVRTPGEIEEGEIPGYQMINFMSPEFANEIDQLDRDKTYLVYCRSGGRSANACNAMSTLGFSSLFNLLGGINAWNSAEKA